ncbi:hypothetical protein DSLASN_23060 [Desulfoluna limicola]|uniref:LPXTG cell wall anchor domain-containing protein n=1 Tax=Desulfoluna limicola TaxID=2810562 RepID=A0ABM7PGF8_9BACT|nr:hypothetical protein DSLASN_23060 [Desulfoluna limicola]
MGKGGQGQAQPVNPATNDTSQGKEMSYIIGVILPLGIYALNRRVNTKA